MYRSESTQERSGLATRKHLYILGICGTVGHLTYFAQEKASEQVFRYAPRHGESRADSQGTANVEDLRKGILDRQLEGNAEQHVSCTTERNFPPPSLLAALLVAQR